MDAIGLILKIRNAGDNISTSHNCNGNFVFQSRIKFLFDQIGL